MKIGTLTQCDDPRIHAYGVTLEALANLGKIFDHSFRSEIDITQSWFEALLRIERSGGFMPMGELAEQITITSGGVTRLVDRLEEAGYVERRSCATDRRVQYAAITEAGRQVLARALDAHLDDLETYFNSHMSLEERETIVAVFDRIRQAASARPYS